MPWRSGLFQSQTWDADSPTACGCIYAGPKAEGNDTVSDNKHPE